VEIKNKNKHASVHDVVLTGYIEEFLARNNYAPETILPKGKTIDLLEKIGIGYGGYKAEEIEITHPKTKEILERAGALVGAPVMGFDFIIPDITADPDNQFWGIIECNSLPFIDLHHFPLEGKPINAAGYVWDLWGK
jgi:D-alanine-D-alanine ligase-like ATP-grasp enzyme